MATYYEAISEQAEDFMEEYKDELLGVINDNVKLNENDIFEDCIYQKWDLYGKIQEWLDTAWYGFIRENWANDFKTEFQTCAFIIEESENPEWDKGLWEGKEPMEAVEIQGFFTARGDLYDGIEKEIKELIRQMKGK